MAVTVSDLAVAVRVSGDGADVSPAQTAILTRILGVCDAHISKIIPDAPDAIKDQCIVQFGAYLYDQPVASRDSYSDGWVNSGAGALAARWR